MLDFSGVILQKNLQEGVAIASIGAQVPGVAVVMKCHRLEDQWLVAAFWRKWSETNHPHALFFGGKNPGC